MLVALVVGNDVEKAKELSLNDALVVVVDLFHNCLDRFHQDIRGFPNIIVIKSPLEYIAKSFFAKQFDVVHISKSAKVEELRYNIVTLLDKHKNGIQLPVNDVTTRAVEGFNAEQKNNHYFVYSE